MHHRHKRKVSLVGWSLGGVYAFYAAHAAADCVRCVISLGSPIQFSLKKSPEVRQKLFEQGWQAVGTSPDGMRTRVKEEAAIMSKIISTNGIKLQ